MFTFAFEGYIYIANVYIFSGSHFRKVNVFCQSCVFKTWKLKHGKSYGSARHYGWHQANEEKFRKSIWINNKAKIELCRGGKVIILADHALKAKL